MSVLVFIGEDDRQGNGEFAHQPGPGCCRQICHRFELLAIEIVKRYNLVIHGVKLSGLRQRCPLRLTQIAPVVIAKKMRFQSLAAHRQLFLLAVPGKPFRTEG